MVNRLSERAREDQTRFAANEVKKAESRLARARGRVLALQRTQAEFNPLQSAETELTIRGQLEGELVAARAELMQAQAFMQPTAPEVVAMKQRVAALTAQLKRTNRRLVGKRPPVAEAVKMESPTPLGTAVEKADGMTVAAEPTRAALDSNSDGEGPLNTSIATFEATMTEKEFAEAAYKSSLTALEMARVEAARQHRYLSTISSPSHPESSTYPRRIYSILTVAVVSLLIVGIGSLMIASIREHARV
jgi:capsular polysaccharide transport system permease protein